jgi:hypothetical protein
MARFISSGNVWELELSHDEVRGIAAGGNTASGIATSAGQPYLAAVLTTIVGVLVTVDAIGGKQGVNVVGVFGTQFVTVVPRFASPVHWISQFSDALIHVTGLPGGVVGAGIGAGVALLAIGPAGVVMGGVAGFLAAPGGGANPGDVHADRQAVGPWEKFALITLSNNNVALLSWRGYFCAEAGGGQAVHANRHLIGPWETATLIRNGNGTVSLRAQGGHYFVAENGGGAGSVCNWNRVGIGEWEQFWMEYQPDGMFALKTLNKGTYVSVQ